MVIKYFCLVVYDYNPETKNLFEMVPPHKKRNKVPDALNQLMKIDLSCDTITSIEGPDKVASHNSSIILLSGVELMIFTCDPHLFVYSKMYSFKIKECEKRAEFGGCIREGFTKNLKNG